MKDNKYRVTSFRDEIFVDEKNIEEVIYRLNTSYEMMKGLYEDSVEEIERLNNDIKVLLKENENKEKVIKAQDNIINEFEEWLNAKYEEMHDIWYIKVLNKLKELKGSDKK